MSELPLCRCSEVYVQNPVMHVLGVGGWWGYAVWWMQNVYHYVVSATIYAPGACPRLVNNHSRSLITARDRCFRTSICRESIQY